MNKPLSSSELAGLLNLTPRQINYSIKGVKTWLNQYDQDLKTLPGAGFIVEVPPEQAQKLSQEINIHAGVHIVLSVSQRQQLLALFLLSRSEPQILSQLEQKVQVSRMTITKDLNEIETWLKSRMIVLIRKPHYGILASGEEQAIQQALAEVLWGETPFSTGQIVEISHAEGLVFTLAEDAKLMSLVEYAEQLLAQINLRSIIGLVAKAEDELGGRFTDDAVLYLALAFAISSIRVQQGHHLPENERQIDWFEFSASLAGRQLYRQALGP